MPSFPTMAADGGRLVYNPAFVEKLTPAELEGVLRSWSDTPHCRTTAAALRATRSGIRPRIMVNPILINNGITLPKNALIDLDELTKDVMRAVDKIKNSTEEFEASELPSFLRAKSLYIYTLLCKYWICCALLFLESAIATKKSGI